MKSGHILETYLMTDELAGIYEDEKIINVIENKVFNDAKLDGYSAKDKGVIIDRVFAELKGYGIIQEFLEDDDVTEIMINGTENILIEKNCEFITTDKHFKSKEQLYNTIQKISSSVNKSINKLQPILDMALKDGSRVNVVLDPISINGPTVTIRKFTKKLITLENMCTYGNIDKNILDFLIELVRTRKSIFVNGGTGSGKTTLLNALIEKVALNERIIIIEDAPEIRLNKQSNVIRLEPRLKSYDSDTQVSVSDLIKTSLRMRPDRIIVGEVRGEETLHMLQALNTGHDGSLSSGHANSNEDMLYRIETMIMMFNIMSIDSIRRQIASGIDFLISVKKFSDGVRRVTSIQELCGLSESKYILKDYFKLEEVDEKVYEFMDSRSIVQVDVT